MIRTADHVTPETQTASNSERWRFPPPLCNVTSEVNYCLSDSARLQTADWTLSLPCLCADSVHLKGPGFN